MQENTGVAKKEPKQLPKLQDLHHAPEVAFKNDELKTLLNQPVPEKLIKRHPYIKADNVNLPYLPIDKVELLLDKIFQEWKVEVLNVLQLFNAVSVTIRLHYKNPLTGEWFFHDGVGAMGVQTDKGASASDLGAIKQDSVMKALPAAKSYAIKDAADHLGTLFGRNLNRKDTLAFVGAYEDPQSYEASPQQYIYIEQLIASSVFDEERKKDFENKLEHGITYKYAVELINTLKDNQRDPIASGDPYSQTDIKKKIEREINGNEVHR